MTDSFYITNPMASSTETLSLDPPINCHESANPNQPDQNADSEIQPSMPLSTDGDHHNPAEKRKREDEPLSNSEPDPSLNPLWKTSLCSYFRTHSGNCRHGSTCRYAHGEEELRPRPDNTWDPTSQRAKKAKQSENGEKRQVKEEAEDVMMTEVVVDGDAGGGEDSELSKCLVHLPRKWSSDNLKSFLAEHEILFKSAKKKKGMTVGFVNFENAEQLSSAMEKLEGISVGNKNLKVANVIPRSFEKQVKLAMAYPQNTQETDEPALVGEIEGLSPSSSRIEDGTTNNDSSAVDGSVSRPRSAQDVVTPLAHMPYSDQLEHKKNSIAQMLKKLTRNARKACPNGVSLPEWILKSREIGGLPCQLEGILESPVVNGYRNKCEFSVGYSLQGKPTVGFMLGNFREGVTAVEEPMDCPNVSVIACKYASVFQEFLQYSNLPIWNRFKNTGFWRQLAVREGRTPQKPTDAENLDASISEVMLIVQVCSTGIDDSLVNSEFEKLSQAFAAGASATSPSLPLTALVVQDHQGISNVAPADAPLRLLRIPKPASGTELEGSNDFMEARIHDCISNLRFCISPTAFFQVNTLAAEKLYSLAGDWADLGPDTLLFDVCCGTGTIGLTLAHRVGMVIGIEMNASAVSDAHRNAEINGIKNCKFVCAKAEDVMGSLLREYLNVPEKQGDHVFKSNDKEIATTEEKDSSLDNVLHSEGSSVHEPENGVGTSECEESSRKEPQNQVQKGCTEDENSSVRQFKNVVAIVDPPRGGLHPTVIKALRTHPHLQRLVYISCNPETLVANAIELCTPSPEKVEKGNKDNRGWRNMSSAGLARHRTKSMPVSEPFRPVKAMAVDLFPHTSHCEMVMLLER
ncbi:zinc finger CCCH domain-containing protein 24 isoform X1 [Mangifera indica]|uniref:zinc finger CCCH domain-containing protein 24 isoform X1 n=1 Tax=Mangifera indica TaxID=29780 RepID=UPI001CFBD6F3|nr:zinc finger CCCH domain-containing protein 24 isoform X1 [Mangifera indica]